VSKIPSTTEQTATPTSARASATPQLYRLPSGNVAQLRQVGVLALASVGRNLIADDVLCRLMANTLTPPQTEAEQAKLIRENGAAYLVVAKLAFVSPQLADEPDYDRDQIAPGDLSDADLLWLWFTFVQGDAASVAAFRLS